MKIKFTVRRYGLAPADLLATVDVGAKVGDLAEYLAAADPGASGAPGGDRATLCVVGETDTAVDPRLAVGDSGLRSGMTIAVTRRGAAYAEARPATAAVVTVTAGPDVGREYPLSRGSNVIGRDRGCEVALTDLLVSRQHARLNITDIADIIDLGSANGVQMGESFVARSPLGPGDTVRLGDTELSVRVIPTAGTRAEGAVEGFVRSPRLDRRYEGVELSAPEPPARPQIQRFPIVALVTPLLMGGALYAMTRSVTSLVFIALSPMMIIGYAVEATLAGRSAFKRALKQYRADVAALETEARAAAAQEVAARDAEHPGLAACVDAVRRGTPLLWTRRPADPGFCELRLGTGRQPARNAIELPTGRGLPRDLVTELASLVEGYRKVEGVPVVARPAEHGSIGLAGPRSTMLASARALVIQAVALHSPAELVLAGFAATGSARDWDWLKWLPHTTSPHSPLATGHLAGATGTALTLISELEDLLTRRASGADQGGPALLVLVEDDAPVERSRLVDLAERGWAHGVHVLWLAADTALLPAACRMFVALEPESATGAAGFAHDGERVEPLTVDLLDAGTALDLARRLSPLVDTGALVDDNSDLPRSVALLAVSERPLTVSPEAVIERWSENRSILTGRYAPARPAKQAGTLRAVIGRSAAGAHVLDLRTDGPHALVGGTTGSGKSELLQSWILAMAAAHSPQRLTFLLVDYKGGSAFRELEDLPHTVGLVDDLSPHLVRRALTSLSAELRSRERLFAKHRVKDLVELEKQGSTDAPPSLVIVVDEFAALVTELPEFVDGVINVAQRGRSLGVHLILATQRPAGVIKDNLRANTNLRLALRTADEADSADVLGSTQAAFFDPELPGRAVSKTGPGRLVPFQAGYAGGWTTDEPAPPRIQVEELRFGGGPVWEPPATEEVPADPGPTDIQRLVAAIAAARLQAEIHRPRRPWLPDLQPVYDLAELPYLRRDDELVFGIQDVPEEQAQPTVAFRPDTDGNLAVYGTGGSGKSTLLRTLAIAAGFTVRGGPCHVYGLDFGARGLAMLEDLPHVGSVISGTDHERVVRLLSWLGDLVADRAARYAAADVGTVTDYRRVPGIPGAGEEPRILVMLDGVAAFRQAYEVGERSRWFDAFCAIASDGRPVGVHVLLTADRPASVPSALASAMQTRVVLRMVDPNEYSMMGVPADVLGPTSPPGRGLLGGSEIQVAILGKAADVGSQAANVRRFATSMIRAGVPVAPAIERLPDRVPLASLPEAIAGRPTIGLAATTLSPHTFVPRGGFLVAGPPGSGRTSALRAMAVSLRRWNPRTSLYYFGSRRSALARLDLWTGTAFGVAEAGDLAKDLAQKLPLLDPGQPAAVFVENISEFVNTPADLALTDLVKACLAEEHLVVAEGETTTLSSGSVGLIAQVKLSRTGLALAPDSTDGAVFRTTFPPRLSRADFPPGRALFVSGGRTAVVQVGLVGEG
ncbi:cell division protein FtsK [Longispora fulva]|uniref:S-DNA-T family DNA segregation ATPase FtsK/SpoIIIE n=1 Tax=Longispora fulva TaxID=619741 RepID=A0A8J7GKF2_9ACTN|nr:FtsK/SpoIIIE domain-containing protein [Longispora fulva]MBG6139811.1 S-DNA-T family DNA segregation ATPase FtsK/SpoIIIE [Longispora fulva]GIG57805.1 cell division protein FtsK [Longispora fulva]